MSTSIEWTDETWNPTTGCSKVSPGCKHCYAERLFPKVYPGRAFTDVRVHPDRLDAPLHWKKPRRVFVNSMSDLFHDSVPDEFISKVWLTMLRAKQHTFQILTKRPQRMRDWLDREWRIRGVRCTPPAHVWLGVSVEDQKTADERIPLLLQTPAAVRFVSYEPALGPVDLTSGLRVAWQCSGCRGYFPRPYQQICPKCGKDSYWSGSHAFNPPGGQIGSGLDWVICGGESGPGARPCEIEWLESVAKQCKDAGVACFVKQLGAVPVMDEERWHSAPAMRLLSAKNAKRAPAGTVPIAMSDRKGKHIEEFPPLLQIREYPGVTP